MSDTGVTRHAGEAKGAVKLITLALQGGGFQGAFAWGVLDRLLEDERLAIEGVSATSAGAMNAAVLAYGLLKGGPPGARASLHNFWQDGKLNADWDFLCHLRDQGRNEARHWLAQNYSAIGEGCSVDLRKEFL
ncbi:patatin-like phospholipase family protein [Cupriavidus sp. AcVe19-1a]|uniref:patatin-like phospholipase family protein n=1 Tax=unclassified Cupriavidus TaxID=2640874 RepID=UPI001AE9EBD3|nr:patatin-like phospholipase family protein [Cupriavidus sp. AcVe19-1a]MBP0639755.1 patatin-like phospholipase family protein [Cupriavidus sp. AcVe19-6a]